MQQSLSSEADSISAAQEITRILIKSEGLLPCSEEPTTTGSYPEPTESIPHPT
jgi:hypothetical protein